MKLFFLLLTISFSVAAREVIVKREYTIKEKANSHILFVVDNSGSMGTHQQVLAGLSDNFLQHFEKSEFQITAISTDKSDPFNSAIIDHTAADPVTELVKLITSFGTNGAADELVFAQIKAFMNSPEGKAFVSANKHLEVIVLTDEEEQSAETVTDMLSLRAKDLMTVSSFLPSQGCAQQTRHNSKIEDLVNQTQGMVLDLCLAADRLAVDFEALARAIKSRGQRKVVPLKSLVLPEQVQVDTIRVNYGTQIIARGLIDKGWVFNVAKNAIIFGDDIVLTEQPEDTKLVIQYSVEE